MATNSMIKKIHSFNVGIGRSIYALCIMSTMMLLSSSVQAQYTLDRAITDVRNNSSLAKLIPLIDADNELSNANTNKRLYPQINIVGQASYQSETSGLDLSFPGIEFDRLSKDQYKLQAEISQILYDGGATSVMKNMKDNGSALEKNGVALQMNDLVEQCINIYFTIKELELRIKQTKLKEEDINASLKKMQAGVDNGVILKSELRNLEAENIKLGQQTEELKSFITTQRRMLSLLTANDDAKTEDLIVPNDLVSNSSINPNNPQIKQYLYQKETLALQQKMDNIAIQPKLAAFAQLGYGKPGLNFLKNQFDTYYIGGLKLQWNLSALYSNKNTKQINQLNQDKLLAKQESTETMIRLKNEAKIQDINRLTLSLKSDQQVIQIRKQIKETSNVQLENGAITTTEYLIKLNDENEAVLNEAIHQLQIIKASYLIHHNNGWTN